MNESTLSGDSSPGNQTTIQKPIPKKKRNLPGMPDPDADVIALSPKTLMATNRFVCEICSKGFQRDQNLQLHRRGHNLPWKLRQRSSKDVKKRVYVCPEPSCVHHEPSRALGDLTGIKKHFCRKHGEKKWKCDKCSKKYAVQSDWKAHFKICGTREYKCQCGTVFSRRDSYITHRAFCDALADETAKSPAADGDGDQDHQAGQSPPQSPTPLPRLSSPPEDPCAADVAASSIPDSANNNSHPVMDSTNTNATSSQLLDERPGVASLAASCSSSSFSSSSGSSSSNIFASLFASSTSSPNLVPQTIGVTDLFQATARPDHTPDVAASSSEPISLCLAVNQGSSIFGKAGTERRQYPPAPQPALSATALLQKASQIGAAASNASLLRGLGIASSSSSINITDEWSYQKNEPNGLGLGCDSGSGLKELMLGIPSVFGPKHTTLDLLGLGMAASGGSTGGLLMTSTNGVLDVTAAAQPFTGRE